MEIVANFGIMVLMSSTENTSKKSYKLNPSINLYTYTNPQINKVPFYHYPTNFTINKVAITNNIF